MGERYDGPLCYVPPGGIDVPARFGRTRRLVGGWHYSTRIVRGQELPHKRLYLDLNGPEPFYRFADKTDASWDERNPQAQIVQLPGLEGEHPPEAYSDHPYHEAWKADQAFERGET